MKLRLFRPGLLWIPLLSTLLLVPRVGAQSNLVLLVSPPGDYIGGGATSVTTNSAEFTFTGSSNFVAAAAFGYWIEIAAPSGMQVGIYTNAARYPFNGEGPGLTVSGNGRGCNTVCGEFEVLEIHLDEAGQVDRFWATFKHQCECFMPTMTGEVRFNSLLAPPPPEPRNLRVPEDFPTIQMALDNVSLLAVDTVLVSSGVYVESINFAGRRARLLSAEGPGRTFIQAPPDATAITFGSGETSDALISGFTITNSAGGISVSSATPTIVSNVITRCGTGIGCNFASPTIRGNQILDGNGPGIALGGESAPLIEQNIIRRNQGGITMWAAGFPVIRNNILQGNTGDGINMVNWSDADIIQNVIAGNTGNGIAWLVPWGARGPRVINNTIVGNGGAGIAADGYDATSEIINNIIVGSPALSVGGMNDANPPTVLFNDIFSKDGIAYDGLITDLTGTSGNISADPLFVCEPSDDLRLLAISPAIDAGTNAPPDLPNLDLAGITRLLSGRTNQPPTVDIGAFEFDPSAPPAPCLYVDCSTNIVVAAPIGADSVVVHYPAPTGSPVATITSSPTSGSVFPAGDTTVTATASFETNSAHCSFTVTVLVSPKITNQPSNLVVQAGDPIVLTVGVSGSEPLHFRWDAEGTPIPGATDSTLVIPNAQAADEGIYRAIVANNVGAVTSKVSFVRVQPSPPVIVMQPTNIVALASSARTFEVVAKGSEPLLYQWLFDGAPIPGATGPRLSINNIQSTNAGQYQVTISNAMGTITSSAATLTATAARPDFVVHPLDASIPVGTNYLLHALVRGSEPFTYQWQLEGINIPGAIAPELSLTNVALSESGAYRLIASNMAGLATSRVARVTVYQTPGVLHGLTNLVVDAGSTVTLSFSASGTPTPAFSWRLNGTRIPGTNSTLTITNIQPNHSGYYEVTATNRFGGISSTARVSVLGPASTVIAWGDNSAGQTNVPSTLVDAVAVTGGDFHSLVLRHNGALLAWGDNTQGQTEIPTNALRFVAIASGAAHNLAIAEDGSVLGWGRNDFGQATVPASVTSALSVAAGQSHSLALLSSGRAVGWGDNSHGQYEFLASSLKSIRAIAAGRNHSLALFADGTVIGYGFNMSGQAEPPADLNGVASIAAGWLHSAALRSNGTVVVWGDNSFGQTNVPAGLSNVTAIAAGDFHTIALCADGSVVSWGDRSFDQTQMPSNVNQAVGIGSGLFHSMALVPNRSVPFLAHRRISNSLVFTWDAPALLQWAAEPNGPYNDFTTPAQNSATVDLVEPARFYRLRQSP